MKMYFALVSLSALSLAQPAAAGEAPAHRSQVVQYADLDLATDRGRARLDHRIRVAVREVCGTASDADLEGKTEVRRCRAAAGERVSEYRAIAIAAAANRSSTSIALRRDHGTEVVTASAATN